MCGELGLDNVFLALWLSRFIQMKVTSSTARQRGSTSVNPWSTFSKSASGNQTTFLKKIWKRRVKTRVNALLSQHNTPQAQSQLLLPDSMQPVHLSPLFVSLFSHFNPLYGDVPLLWTGYVLLSVYCCCSGSVNWRSPGSIRQRRRSPICPSFWLTGCSG